MDKRIRGLYIVANTVTIVRVHTHSHGVLVITSLADCTTVQKLLLYMYFDSICIAALFE